MSYEQQLRSPRKAHRTSAAWPASRSGQASCLEVETLSDPEEHISRPVASAGSGKCLRLLACLADCSPCNKWESILLGCNNPLVSVWSWQGAECRQKLTVEEFSSLEYVPGVGYLMSISTVHLRHNVRGSLWPWLSSCQMGGRYFISSSFCVLYKNSSLSSVPAPVRQRQPWN